MTFFVGEKVLASGKTWIVSNKHPNKKAYFLKNDDGKGWWFDEDKITRITPQVKPNLQTDRQKAIERNNDSRSKYSKKGTKSFMMLE